MHKLIIVAIVLLSAATYYFTGVGFGFSGIEQIVATIAVAALLYFAARKGTYQFTIVAFTFFSTVFSLGCSFLHPVVASGPFALSIVLDPWIILTIAAVLSMLVLFFMHHVRARNSFAAALLAAFVINWLILAINVKFFDDWKMENWLTVPFVIIIYIMHRWFKLSNVSYALIFVYMMLHIYGSHYTYAEVPAGFWMQHVFDLTRNHYDRIVHFSFGFLLAYPLRELIIRISDTKGFWGYWFPVEFVLAFSCIYELLEWAIAVIFGGDLGVAYLGSQGDIWDAQKDMFNAGVGAIIAMMIIAGIVWYYRRGNFWHEMKESLSVKHKRALGEVALEHIMKEKE